MSTLMLAIYIASFFLSGGALLSFVGDGGKEGTRKTLELFSVSFISGCGLISLLQFFMALCDFKPSFCTIGFIFLLSFILFYVSGGWRKMFGRAVLPTAFCEILCEEEGECCGRRSHASTVLDGKKLNLLKIIPMFAISLALIIVAVNSILTPLWDMDSFALWGLKAKALYLNGLDKGGYFLNLNYGFSHLDYPLLMPFATAGAYAAVGSVSQNLGKILYIPLFISLAVFLYFSSARIVGRKLSLLLVAIYLSLPALLQWSAAGTADIYLVAFYMMALFSAVDFVETGKREPMMIAIFAAAFCAFTKNEGIPIVMIICTILLAGAILQKMPSKQIKMILCSFIVVPLVLLPWFIWSADIPRIHENYPAQIHRLFNLENLMRFPDIIQTFLLEALKLTRWGVFWLIPILLAPFVVKTVFRDRRVAAVSIALFLNIGLYIVIFIITPWSVAYLAASPLERLFLHLSAPYFILSVLLVSHFLKKTD